MHEADGAASHDAGIASTSGSPPSQRASLAALERAYWATPSGVEALLQRAFSVDDKSGARRLAAVAQQKPPGQTRGEPDRKPDYYANVGDAIRTLRDDIPRMFEQDLSYDIYREDITFKDPRHSFQGMDNYKRMFWALRFHGRMFFSKLFVEVKRMWQPEDGVIKIRWTVHGIPRLPWEAEGIFDGISTYKLDSAGKIYEHSVDNVLLSDPPHATHPMAITLNLMPTAGAGQTPQLGSMGCVARGDAETTGTVDDSAAGAAPTGSAGSAPAVMAVTFSWVRLYAVVAGSAAVASLSALTYGHDADAAPGAAQLQPAPILVTDV